jgi:hypothetical protein
MANVIKGRMTAELDGDFVVFLIGMRINKPWKLPQMAAGRPGDEPDAPCAFGTRDLGLLGFTSWIGPHGPMLRQYWRSFADLERFARDSSLPHHAAWRTTTGAWAPTVMLRLALDVPGPSGTSRPCTQTCPMFGLAAAGRHVPVAKRVTPRRTGWDSTYPQIRDAYRRHPAARRRRRPDSAEEALLLYTDAPLQPARGSGRCGAPPALPGRHRHPT